MLLWKVAVCVPKKRKLWIGEWDAKWHTDSSLPDYEGLPDTYEFEMNGKFEFTCEEVTITIMDIQILFLHQTPQLTLRDGMCQMRNPLQLLDKDGYPSLPYTILNQSDDKIELTLVGDIFITLTPKD